jgi:hypothetical protein
MLKFVSKFVLEILPSIVATVIGAYIVNHYIIAKPANPAPVVAASSTAPAAKAASTQAEIKPPVQPAAVNIDAKAAASDKVAATLPRPAEAHERPSTSHERPPIKAAASVPEPAWQNRERREREAVQQRDANELARAAIDRLGVVNRNSRAAEVAAPPRDPAPVAIAAAPALRPLPPAINISTPAVELARTERNGEPTVPARIDAASEAARADSDRLIPPAEIPPASQLSGPPTDAATMSVSQRPNVADDMFAAAKSVFHAVLPR